VANEENLEWRVDNTKDTSLIKGILSGMLPVQQTKTPVDEAKVRDNEAKLIRQLQTLVEMGFQRNQAEEALKIDGTVETAIASMISQ
jgi:hypothetical protein